MMLLPTPAEMYRALVERDRSFEGLFFACVRTTGIFCRPTCSARKPKPENVEYASTIQDALHRGYRPCRICDPMSSAASAPNWLAPLVDEMLRNPDIRLRDDDLRQRGLDPVQVRRTFKRSFGMTFQAYQRACRLGTAMRALHEGAPTLDAGLDAGIRLRQRIPRGVRERLWRDAGRCPRHAAAHRGLDRNPARPDAGGRWRPRPGATGVRRSPRARDRTSRAAPLAWQRDRSRRSPDPAADAQGAVASISTGTRREFTMPLNQRGSDFQLKAWRALCGIPYGETRSYSDMAREVGSPAAVRAIGRVNGQNRIAIIVPCHRVIRADGTLCGYGGGRWRKQWLLDHEQAVKTD